jgi:hypothetical protein
MAVVEQFRHPRSLPMMTFSTILISPGELSVGSIRCRFRRCNNTIERAE